MVNDYMSVVMYEPSQANSQTQHLSSCRGVEFLSSLLKECVCQGQTRRNDTGVEGRWNMQTPPPPHLLVFSCY